MKSTRPAYRLLSLLLALVMVLGMLPAPHASAAGEVTYEKVSTPESGKTYVIVANNYAMTSAPHDGYTNSTDYKYSGLTGVKVTASGNSITGDLDETAYWTITANSSGYTIQNSNGKYLKATLTKRDGYTNAFEGKVFLTNEPEDTWSLSSSDNTLQSAAASINDRNPKNTPYFLVYDEGASGITGSAKFFGIRSESNADEISFYEVITSSDEGGNAPPATEYETYEKITADKIVVGMEIVIVAKDGSNYYALTSVDGDPTDNLPVRNSQKTKVTVTNDILTLPKDGSASALLWTVGNADTAHNTGGKGGAYTFTNGSNSIRRVSGSDYVQTTAIVNSGSQAVYFGHNFSNGTFANGGSSNVKYHLGYGSQKSGYGSDSNFRFASTATNNITFYAKSVPTATLTGITVTAQPTKTTYNVGDDFDAAGMVVTATYSDNSSKPITGYTVTDGENLAATKTFVTISYTEGDVTKTATCNITVKAVEVETYEKITADKIVVGMEIVIVAKDGSNYYALTNVDGDPSDVSVRNSQKTKVTVTNDILSLPKDGSADALLWKVGTANSAQNTGSKGGAFTLTNGSNSIRRVSQSDYVRTTAIVNSGDQAVYFGHNFSNGTFANGGSSNVKYHLGYGSQKSSQYGTDTNFRFASTATNNITFYAKPVPTATLTGITVTAQPTKTTYEVGDDFDTAGMTITASYSDGSSKPVTGYTVTNGNNLTASQTQVEITYSEGGETKVTYVSITVKEKIQESSDIHLAFTSDIHNGASNTEATRLNTWLTNVGKKIGDTFETMAFAGDNGSAYLRDNDFWDAVQAVMDVVINSGYVKDDGFFVNGNHEFQNGSQGNTSNATAGKIKNIGAKIVTDNYVIYGFGAASGSQSFNYSEASASDISRLDDYLKTVPTTTPVFVISHFPIHYCSGQIGNRTSANADKLVKVLNNYPNVIFLWGHNHTESDPLYDEVFKSGKELQLTSSSSSKVTINFTYAAAGCMSDSDYTSGSGSVKGKGLVAKVEGSKVTLTYYDANGNKVGTSTEITIISHDHSYSTDWKTDGTNHWKECSCGDKKDIGTHSDAATDKDHECDTCGKEDVTEHSYSTDWKSDETNHWKECNCGDKKDSGTHSDAATDKDHECDTCGKEDVTEHSYSTNWKSDETNHWKECNCGDKKDNGTHSDATTDKDHECDTCGKEDVTEHSYSTNWKSDETNHWKECNCGDKKDSAAHSDVATDKDHKCDICEKDNVSQHSYSTEWKSDATNHWHECNCGDTTDEEAHIPGDPATETTNQICTKCEYVINTAIGHICKNHLTLVQGQDATCGEDGWDDYYKCSSSCNKLYEDVDAENEITNLENWKKNDGKIPATGEHTDSATDKDHICDVCQAENVTNHSYNTTEWKKNATQHWHECACGAKSDEANHIPGAAATEDTAQTCTKCEYVITPALGHIHTKHLTEVPAQPATCTEPGNTLYYTCDCGRWFSDANATTEITNKESVKTALAKHTSAKVTGQAATCTVDGWKDYYECSVCHAPFIDEALTNPIADLAAWKVGGGKIAAAHTYGNLIPEVPTVHTQTELKAGTKAHYKCAVCSKFFDTEKKEVTEASLTIAAPEHNYSLAYAKNETQHWHECACGAKFRVENHTSGGPATETESEICTVCEYVINAPAGHIHTNHLTLVAGKDATCTEAGSVQHYSCSCGKLFLDANATQETTNTVLPAKGHTEVIQNAVEATCTEDGLTEGSFCNVCGTVFKAQETIAASGHTAIVEDEVEATCDKDGSTAGIYCEVCGEYLTLPEVIPALGHDWDEGEVTRKPTNTLPGVMTYTCQRCDATRTEEIPFAPAEIYRISGDSRVETALAAADALKEALGVETFNSIIIAYGDDFADALAGSYLAAVKGAPILLHVKSGAGDDRNEYYIDKNLADGGTVYILGGTSAVPESIEDGLKATGYKVIRLAGSDRYETGLAILKEAGVSDTDEILIATGGNFADCLSASATGKPILTVNSYTNKLTNAQVEFLKAHSKNQYAIIGGTAAISQTLEDAIDAIVEKDIIRVYGDNREATSVRVAKRYFEEPTFALIAFSGNFPDGLCAGPLAYALGAPLLLTSAGQEAVTAEYISSNGITSGYVMGGPAVISDTSARACFGITSAATIPVK